MPSFNTRTESTLENQAKTTEVSSPTVQLTSDDNRALASVRSQMSQTLKDSGVLPELSISGGTNLDYVTKNFAQLDKSKDGFVSKDEIDQYMKDNAKTLKPEEMQALKNVSENIDKLGNLHRDLGDWTKRTRTGVSQDDLKDANAQVRVLDYAQKNFDALDGNHDGHITKDELEAYKKKGGDKLSDDEKKVLDYLQNNVSRLEQRSDDDTFSESGITRHDLLGERSATGVQNVESQTAVSSKSNSSGDMRYALDYAKQNFDKMDGDKDGTLTADEIQKYMDTNKDKLSADETANLKAVKDNLRKIDEQSDGATDRRDGRITKDDLTAGKGKIDALVYAQENFAKLDKDGNGHISTEELDQYAKNNPNLSEAEKQNLASLKKNMFDLQNKHDDSGLDSKGISKHDLIDGLQELGSGAATNRKSAADNSKDAPKDGRDPKDANRGGGDAGKGEHPYTVKPGDSLWKICREELKQRNGGKDASNADILRMVHEMARINGNMPLTKVIKPGDVLKVPGAGSGGGSCEVPPAPRPVPLPKPECPPAPKPECPPAPKPECPPEPPKTGCPTEPVNPRTEEPPQNNQQEKESATQVLQRRFSEIDKNGNNKVNRKEIESYLNEHSQDLTAEEIKALDHLARNASKIESMVDDEKGPENDGMSRKDLDKLQQVQKASADMLQSGMFKELDSDRNNFLSKEEITKALTTKRLTREERMTLEFLKDNLKILQKGTDDEKGRENNGVSNADMRYYASMV